MTELPSATPLTGADNDYDGLLESIGDARFVLIGEASHGTHDFYAHRARITERLIREKGFLAVAAEADWPDAYHVNRYLMGGDGETPLEALEEFRRFPLWMWRNTVVRDFVRDMRAYNDEMGAKKRVGFYGLDLYSLHGSIAAVIEYLEGIDPDAARRARDRYGCLESPDQEPQRYGMEASFGVREPCEDEVIAQLVELLRRSGDYAHRDGGGEAEDEFFFAEQNARLVVDAEAYYRGMFRGGRDDTWNRRDTHMADTLDALDRHLTRRSGGPAKIVVWAHNSHLGDARATDMGWERDELNLGQLARTRHTGETFIVGFTTYTGTVTAANDWGSPHGGCACVPPCPVHWRPVARDGRKPRFRARPA
jgi:erythromycin esterase-like protein